MCSSDWSSDVCSSELPRKLWSASTNSCIQKCERLVHEGIVILEYATMPGILVQDEIGARDARGKRYRVRAGHHDVMIAIGDQHRLMNCSEILRRLLAPGLDRGPRSEEHTSELQSLMRI